MRITFLGAARMVTGSCYLLEAGGLRILVDCGMFQGKEDDLNHEPFPLNPAGLDFVILTHAHIDHSGRLPLLCKQGYRGPIYAHPATAELAEIMLLDSAHIQEADAERLNRKAGRAGRPQEPPLYTQDDARITAKQFKTVPYGELKALSSRVRFRLQDAGHILGSAIIEVFETGADGGETKLVFSGDIGQPDRPILRDPTIIDSADYLVMESTYGNRLHDSPESKQGALAEIIRSTIARGGNVIVPSFAVGRTQELLYSLNKLVEAGELPRGLRVVVDSPLAIAATQITAKHVEVFDEEAHKLVRSGDQPFAFPGLLTTATAEESKALNNDLRPMVIIAASGMCEAGRVVHHLKHNLWRAASTILFVGYQAEGTLGRIIHDGAKHVRIHGEDVAVRAHIETLHGFSAHADQAQLLAWVSGLTHPPVRTFLVHGEGDAQAELGRLLTERGHRVAIPDLDEAATLEPAGALVPAPARARKQPAVTPAGVAVAQGAAVALSSQHITHLMRELRAVRKAWASHSHRLAPEHADAVARQAEAMLRQLEEMRKLIG